MGSPGIQEAPSFGRGDIPDLLKCGELIEDEESCRRPSTSSGSGEGKGKGGRSKFAFPKPGDGGGGSSGGSSSSGGGGGGGGGAKKKGFNPARALRGADYDDGKSAVRARGDGLYGTSGEKGSALSRNGHKVTIGPGAFDPENFEETMKQLDEMDAFGSRGKQTKQGETVAAAALPAQVKAGAAGGGRTPVQEPSVAEVEQLSKLLSATPGGSADMMDGLKRMFDSLPTSRPAVDVGIEDEVFLEEEEEGRQDMLRAQEQARSSFSLDKRAKRPIHTVVADAGGAALEVKVQLPGVASAAAVELDVTRGDLALECGSVHDPDTWYKLSLPLPFPVDEDSTKAKWLKASSTLKVTLAAAGR